jgi:hypothetical protein
MRIRALFAGLFGLALIATDASAQPAHYGDGGPRGLNGSTYTTGRVPGGDYPGERWDQVRRLGPAGALLFRDPRFQNRLLPCDDSIALERIRETFAQKEERFWNSSLTIAGFDRVRVVSTNPWGQNNIPRRYCTGRALLSDGRVRPVSFAILEDQGIIGSTWGVEWCVHGLDRGRSFDPACRMARP